jgi:hypothetical protein
MRAYLGHDLLGASGPRPPAACAVGATSATAGWWRGPDGDLVPSDLLIDRDRHVAPRRSVEGPFYRLGVYGSVGPVSNRQTGNRGRSGRTYRRGKPLTKSHRLRREDRRPAAREGLVVPRHLGSHQGRLGPPEGAKIAAASHESFAGAHRSARQRPMMERLPASPGRPSRTR